MANNLTNSYRDRQAILNNANLVQKIEHHFNFEEFFWYGRLTYKSNLVIIKQQLTGLLDTKASIVARYLAIYGEELKASGYALLKDKELQAFLATCDPEILHNIRKDYDLSDENRPITAIEVFTFKAWLNIAMLLSESKNAKFVRSRILDIAIDVAAEKEGGQVKYINHRMQYEFFESGRIIHSCSPEFRSATQEYIELDRSTLASNGIRRFSQYNRFAISYRNIYQLVFGNLHEEYKQAILLHTECKEYNEHELVREARFCSVLPGSRLKNALYYEAYLAMIRIEKGVAEKLKYRFINQGKKLEIKELDEIVAGLEQDSEFIPLIQKARAKTAIVESINADPESYQDVLNQRFETHKQAISETNLNEFVRSKSQSLKEKLLVPETSAVFQRLGDR